MDIQNIDNSIFYNKVRNTARFILSCLEAKDLIIGDKVNKLNAISNDDLAELFPSTEFKVLKYDRKDCRKSGFDILILYNFDGTFSLRMRKFSQNERRYGLGDVFLVFMCGKNGNYEDSPIIRKIKKWASKK